MSRLSRRYLSHSPASSTPRGKEERVLIQQTGDYAGVIEGCGLWRMCAPHQQKWLQELSVKELDVNNRALTRNSEIVHRHPRQVRVHRAPVIPPLESI